RSIYDIDDVDEDFKIGFDTDYIIVYVACMALIWNLAVIILNCIARIFNMLFLYLMAPPIFASQSLDNGGKTKQWLTAFLVQSLSVFGTVVAMQLLLIVLPIIAGSELVLFENGLLNIMAKLVLVYGVFEVAKKSTSLFTGILADSAGWQSIQAGDMSASAGKAVGSASGLVTGTAGKVAGLGLMAAGKVGGAVTAPGMNLLSRGWNNTLGRLGGWWSNLGKGNVEEKRAMASARERLASEQAYEKLTNTDEQSASGSSELPRRSDAPASEQSRQLSDSGGRAPLSESAPKSSAPARTGGQKRPLSEGAQKLFGVDANGQVRQKSSAPAQPNGQKRPLSEGAQKLFGVDADGQVKPSAAAQGNGSEPSHAKAGGSREAPSLSNRSSLDRPVMSPPPRRMSFSSGRDETDNKGE
ncbi:MAG: hypothetical protein IJV64_01365, partial [Oscillospiraceae bacterium]|nr:hypothetical protein [Oscillospiraceae bacterium]